MGSIRVPALLLCLLLPLAGGGEEFHFARCSINSIFNRVDRNYRASPNPSNVDRPVRLREASEKHGGTVNRSISSWTL